MARRKIGKVDRTGDGDKTVLEARGLVKRFGDVTALDGVDFSVQKGEVFGLLGSNGAGKTTALKIFAALIRPTAGHALVLDKDVWSNQILVKARTGYLPETPNLYETMTGYELLDLVTTLRSMDEASKGKRISHMAKVLELEEALEEQMGTYSKGMRQKIAFAAAVIHEPPILLLDEPTAGLDPRFGKIFKRWIRNFGAEGKAVLMSTHLTLIAEEICDRVAIIDRGRIVDMGTVEGLKVKHGADTLENVFIQVVGGKDWARLLPSSR